MAQFDLHARRRSRDFPFVLDVQAGLLSSLATRVVVPLMPRKRFGGKPITRLNPTAVVDGVEYVLVFQELAAMPARELGSAVASLRARRSDILAALDLLIAGV